VTPSYSAEERTELKNLETDYARTSDTYNSLINYFKIFESKN
jgi:hypothetical protein